MNAPLGQTVPHKVAVGAGAYREERNIGNFEMADNIRSIIGAAAQRHLLGQNVDVLASLGQMIQIDHHVHNGRTDYQYFFHN